MLYEAYLTAVELDGELAHIGEARMRDNRRDNAAATDGILTLRYSWLDVTKSPCQVAAEVVRVLGRRGFAGARPCSPNCPVVDRRFERPTGPARRTNMGVVRQGTGAPARRSITGPARIANAPTRPRRSTTPRSQPR